MLNAVILRRCFHDEARPVTNGLRSRVACVAAPTLGGHGKVTIPGLD